MGKNANFEPATSALLRVALAHVVLLPFSMREKAKLGGLSRAGIMLSLLGGLFLGVDFTAFNYSIFLVGSGIAMVLLNMQVIILPARAIIFDGYRPPISYYVLVPIMLFGVALTGGVFDPAPQTGPTTFFGFDTAVLGTILGAASGSCYGVYLYATRKASKVNPGHIIAVGWQATPRVGGVFLGVTSVPLDIRRRERRESLTPFCRCVATFSFCPGIGSLVLEHAGHERRRKSRARSALGP